MAFVDETSITELEQRALGCFSALVVGDAAERRRVQKLSEQMPEALFFGDDVTGDIGGDSGAVVVFSIEALRQLLSFDQLKYQAFQQMLYRSKLNQRLSQRGLQLLVYANDGKVVDNLYQLVKASVADKGSV